ncbi:AraC family transcriptional regulator [Vitreoscilla massiliensis]|uniref:AraC family transcriptional regulator n=1 Tax=Vitreoscilla massiliensis TaxID=1689272 RepID=A0ABY4DZ78_9NEIS|nr:helix-turn-helix domain-containing protein [Vitreoscilla massiliensis]UOO87825.1 AraC family transcriptional regulator [Vitreoscilla massiliensis]
MNTAAHVKQSLIYDRSQWQQRVRDVYFNLDVTFRSATGSGRLLDQKLGDINVSCLHSSAMQYQRLKPAQHESYFLITLPLQNRIRMQQGHKDVYCERGQVLLQHANEPYVFEYNHENTLWVMKVPSKLLKQHIAHPENHTARVFDGNTGIGKLLSSNMVVLGQELLNGHLDSQQTAYYNDFLLQLFAQVVKQDAGVHLSDEQTIRQAQVLKIQNFIAANLSLNELNPQYVAAACGISVRYLHSLFQGLDSTFSRYVQQQRLQAAYQCLQQQPERSVSDIVYSCGFNDQSHFTRLFKLTYQTTPLALKNGSKTR